MIIVYKLAKYEALTLQVYNKALLKVHYRSTYSAQHINLRRRDYESCDRVVIERHLVVLCKFNQKYWRLIIPE